MDGLTIIVVIAVVGFGVWNLMRSRKRQAQRLEESASVTAPSELSTTRDVLQPEADQLAPVGDFHVVGREARVTFDVPLPEQGDRMLNDLLVDQAVEVVREKRQTLPIDDVSEIVVFAGKGRTYRSGSHTAPFSW